MFYYKLMARKLPLALGLLLLCTFTISGARKPALSLSFHIEGSQMDGAKMVQPMKLGNPPKTYYFRRQPELTERHVKSYYPFPASDGSYGAAFTLNDSGTKTLTMLSTIHDGSKLLTVMNAEPVDYIQFKGQVNDGVIVVWGGLNKADLAKFDKAFTRLSPKKDGAANTASPNMPQRATRSMAEEKALPRITSETETGAKKERRKLLNFGRKKKDE